jgi:uncharacterized SAM-binding protein YcdF (DUF218 family)
MLMLRRKSLQTSGSDAPKEGLEGDPVTEARASRLAGRRLVRRHPLIASLGLVIVTFLAASSVLFVWPATDRPRRVDAILSLAGDNEAARESTAVSLAKKGYAPVLLFSRGNPEGPACPRVPRVSVVCFIPHPTRTIGEVRWAADYARRHGWQSLMIVSGRTQVTRARLLMDRCFSGQIVMIPAPVQLTLLPYEIIYEWGALAKALVLDKHC